MLSPQLELTHVVATNIHLIVMVIPEVGVAVMSLFIMSLILLYEHCDYTLVHTAGQYGMVCIFDPPSEDKRF